MADPMKLYPNWTEQMKARDKLALRAAHKALDIPEDDMQIEANKVTNVHNHGTSPLTLAGVALAAGLPVALLAGAMYLRTPTASVVPNVPAPTAAAPTVPTTGAQAPPSSVPKQLWRHSWETMPDGTVQEKLERIK